MSQGGLRLLFDAVIGYAPGQRHMMKTSPIAVLLFVVAAFLGALGQFFYKSGAEKAGNTLASYFQRPASRRRDLLYRSDGAFRGGV